MFLQKWAGRVGVSRLIRVPTSCWNWRRHGRKMEVRASDVPQGWKAPQCAGVIHTDFEKDLSARRSSSTTTLSSYGSEGCRTWGRKAQREGKEYVVEDGISCTAVSTCNQLMLSARACTLRACFSYNFFTMNYLIYRNGRWRMHRRLLWHWQARTWPALPAESTWKPSAGRGCTWSRTWRGAFPPRNGMHRRRISGKADVIPVCVKGYSIDSIRPVLERAATPTPWSSYPECVWHGAPSAAWCLSVKVLWQVSSTSWASYRAKGKSARWAASSAWCSVRVRSSRWPERLEGAGDSAGAASGWTCWHRQGYVHQVDCSSQPPWPARVPITTYRWARVQHMVVRTFVGLCVSAQIGEKLGIRPAGGDPWPTTWWWLTKLDRGTASMRRFCPRHGRKFRAYFVRYDWLGRRPHVTCLPAPEGGAKIPKHGSILSVMTPGAEEQLSSSPISAIFLDCRDQRSGLHGGVCGSRAQGPFLLSVLPVRHSSCGRMKSGVPLPSGTKHGQVVYRDTVNITTPIAVPGKTFYTVRIPWNEWFQGLSREARRIIFYPGRGPVDSTDGDCGSGRFDVILLSDHAQAVLLLPSLQYARTDPLDYPLMNAGQGGTYVRKTGSCLQWLTVQPACRRGAHLLVLREGEKYLKER